MEISTEDLNRRLEEARRNGFWGCFQKCTVVMVAFIFFDKYHVEIMNTLKSILPQ
jgi:hypothetical protein